MNLTAIGYTEQTTLTLRQETVTFTAGAAGTAVTAGAAAGQDVYEPSGGNPQKEKTTQVDKGLIDRLLKESQERTESFRKLIQGLVQKQAEKNALALGTEAGSEYNNLLSKIYSKEPVTVEVDEATRLQAQADIAEDGYYGVKQTSERILDFAKALSGGDASKVDLLRDAFKKGYKAAEEAWGGELPQISKDTYDAVMKGFDSWSAAALEEKATQEIGAQAARA